jgi:hypothetical protein
MHKKPVIGLSNTFFKIGKQFSFEKFNKNLITEDVLTAILPGDNILDLSIEANCVNFKYQQDLLFPQIDISKYLLEIETDLIFEQKPSDHISPVKWEFYCSRNSHFYALGGTLRLKFVKENLKIGVYIEELEIKNEYLVNLGINYVKKLIRKEIRVFFQKFEKSLLR